MQTPSHIKLLGAMFLAVATACSVGDAPTAAPDAGAANPLGASLQASCHLGPTVTERYYFADIAHGGSLSVSGTIEVVRIVGTGDCTTAAPECFEWLNSVGASASPQFGVGTDLNTGAPFWSCMGGFPSTWRPGAGDGVCVNGSPCNQ